jgi:hypothetical protein
MVHCNTYGEIGVALRTCPQAFRDVHKLYLHLYVTTYETMVNVKRTTAALIQRMCVCGSISAHY